MIYAALQGKLDCLGSEDALTAVVFGRLRYLPPSVLGGWLATARNHHDPTRAMISSEAEALVEFWPWVRDTFRGQGFVQPDVVLKFGDEIMIVETKLWSPKSAVDGGADQLARQWYGVVDRHGTRSRVMALLYITPHVEPPSEDLDESGTALGDRASHLWWLSWSSLAPILEQQAMSGDRVSRLVAEDLLAYLHAAGVLRFRGWRFASAWKRNDCWRYRHRYWSDYSLHKPLWRYL